MKGIWVLIGVLGVILLLSNCAERKLVNNSVKIVRENASTSIKVHFIHGSKRRKEFPAEPVRIGGLWGGHIEVRVDSMVYGFQHQKTPIHIFPRSKRKNQNSEVTAKPISQWLLETRNDKITTVTIPVTPDQKKQLLTSYQMHFTTPPRDYAVLGFRCTSFAMNELGHCRIIADLNDAQCLLAGAYPAKFRRALLEIAQHNGWAIQIQDGTHRKIWE